MSKKCPYVGGLDDSIDLETLYTIIGSFSEITSIYFPISTDKTTESQQQQQQQRNFVFMEFENNLDARSAIDNMHLSEINGRIIKCNWAHTTTTNKESNRNPDDFEQNKPIWVQEALYLQQQQQ